jgi:hypothetical protein
MSPVPALFIFDAPLPLPFELPFSPWSCDADEISEHADNAAQTFNNVNDALMSRLGEISGAKKSTSTSSKSQTTA